MKILLVDDEMAAISIMRAMIDFKAYGFETVDERYDGEQALAVAENYDVIITDMKMPKMDGLTFIRKAIEEKHVKAKFVIVSAYDDFNLVKTAFRYGVRNYIMKPIDVVEVQDELEKLKEELDYANGCSENAECDEATDASSDIVKSVKKYIDTNFSEKLSLNIIGKRFYINPVYLGQLFKKAYNQYFSDYVLSVRMEHAKELLTNTDLKILEIAKRVSYQDYDYFSISFEKYTGVKPLAYRNGTRKKDGEP